MNSDKPYTLSASFRAHDQDVKDLVHVSPSLIATVSRDQSLKLWDIADPRNITLRHALLDPHSSYINSVTLIPAHLDSTMIFIASGGSDHIIRVWDPDHMADPSQILKGHSLNVCVLAPVPGLHVGLISGSWDKSARVWAHGKCMYALIGHSQAVWGVLALDSNNFITASADRSIKFWLDDTCTKTIEGAHDDVVRALAYLPSLNMFASASNDSKVKVWSRSGDPVCVLNGHTAYIYKVVANVLTNELVSCSEDRSVRVWQDSQLNQTVTLPATTVWSVSVSPSGTDFAACTSDGMVYLFSRDSDRHAPADELMQYEEIVAAASAPQIGDLDKDKLPGMEALLESGTQDGQVLMVRNNAGGVEAHEWSLSGGKWTKIGDVVDAVGSQRKTALDGKQYDYVFDIDVGGEPIVMLKLPYNVTENPYEVAQNFITQNKLSQNYLEEIVQFIIKNTDGRALAWAGQNTSEFVDPLTGSKRYTPAPSTTQATVPVSNAGSNPWTTGYTTSTEAARSHDPNRIVPVQEMVMFKQINYPAITSKILAQQVDFNIKLNPVISSVADVESQPWSVAESMLNHATWPTNQKFPAMDLIRYYVLSNELTTDQFDQVWTWIHTSAVRSDSEAMDMMALRVLVNLFNLAGNRLVVVSHGEAILVLANELRASSNKNIRIGVVTLLLNMSIYCVQSGTHADAMNLIALLVEIVPIETDPETLYRAIAALGTVSSLGAVVKPYVNGLGVKSLLETLSRKEGLEARTKEAINDTMLYLPQN